MQKSYLVFIKSSYIGILLLIKSILNGPLLHNMLYLRNNHPTWLVSWVFQISLGSWDHIFHNNLLFLKLSLTWAHMLSLSQRLRSGMNFPSLWNHLKLYLPSVESSKRIYSKLHFYHKSSVVPCSDDEFSRIPVHDYAYKLMILLCCTSVPEDIGAIEIYFYYYISYKLLNKL